MSSLPAEPIALALETAGSACSVAIARGEQVLAAERRAMRDGHARCCWRWWMPSWREPA
jgi:hypothetical protein